jgi:hypothetical protein
MAFDGPFEAPCHNTINSSYSVQDINRGDIAWLRPARWCGKAEVQPIHAGDSPAEFISKVLMAGGKVYTEYRDPCGE